MKYLIPININGQHGVTVQNKNAHTSPLTGPTGSGGGLRASTRMGLGGLTWLVFSLLLSLWLDDGQGLQERAAPSADARRSAQAFVQGSAESGLAGHAALLAALDSMVEKTLPQALPLARWQHDQSLPGDGVPSVRAYEVSGPCAPLRLALALREALASASPSLIPVPPVPGQGAARPSLAWTEAGTLEIRLDGRVSHSFSFPGRERILADLARPLPPAALILVIDDLGQSLEAAEALVALPFPVTLAIWPQAPKAKSTAALAGQMGLDCLIHLPMEPLARANGKRPRPGAGALWADMSPQALSHALEPALAALPTALGLNNHMGSRFTGSDAACRLLCAQLAGRGFFVLDSLTQPQSRLAEEARAAGLVCAARTVFLDTHREESAILTALDAAAASAHANGFAVAIGHPYPETLRALRRWPNSTGAAVTSLRRLVWHLAQG